jgi:hypothetical protein
MTRPTTATRILLVLAGLLLLSAPAAAVSSDASGTSSQTQASRGTIVLGADTLDLEQESRGYSTEYIFGMSKAVRRSTMHPAVKPMVWLFTIPLDIVLLPFAALGGLF